jgi:histone-lysine N-methyltransferase SETMAR
LHENTPAHQAFVTQNILACLAFYHIDHPSYPPDLAPSDYDLFPGLKKQVKFREFSSDTGVVAAAEACLDGQLSIFFF